MKPEKLVEACTTQQEVSALVHALAETEARPLVQACVQDKVQKVADGEYWAKEDAGLLLVVLEEGVRDLRRALGHHECSMCREWHGREVVHPCE